MIQKKKYNCQKCNSETYLRSTIKEGEFKGLKVCLFCKKVFDKKKSLKSKSKVSDPQKKVFFERMILKLKKNPVCENCGCKINVYVHPVNNIAHILSKRYYKSVAYNEQNILFLCTEKDHPLEQPRNCHSTFDKSMSLRQSMPVFEKSRNKVREFLDVVEEQNIELDVYKF